MAELEPLLPGQLGRTILDRDYDKALHRAEDALNERESGGEPSEPESDHMKSMHDKPAPEMVMTLGPDQRDRQWVSEATGWPWKWMNDRWYHRWGQAGPWTQTPVGYVPSYGPFKEHTAQPLTWRGWAVPAIQEVLAEHGWFPKGTRSMYPSCRCDHVMDDMTDWVEHVAPLIADRIACDPQRAIDALKEES